MYFNFDMPSTLWAKRVRTFNVKLSASNNMFCKATGCLFCAAHVILLCLVKLLCFALLQFTYFSYFRYLGPQGIAYRSTTLPG